MRKETERKVEVIANILHPKPEQNAGIKWFHISCNIGVLICRHEKPNDIINNVPKVDIYNIYIPTYISFIHYIGNVGIHLPTQVHCIIGRCLQNNVIFHLCKLLRIKLTFSLWILKHRIQLVDI
jgi:hypothetical protein